jgi:hypothetical protein
VLLKAVAEQEDHGIRLVEEETQLDGPNYE